MSDSENVGAGLGGPDLAGPDLAGPDLAGVVAARICHDLVSPVGAIVNGTDLIDELGAAQAADEIAMVALSAQRAAAMLKFHRLAFGAIGDPAATLARGPLCDRVRDVVAGPRVQLICSAPEGAPVGLPAARLICLMMLAGRAMLGMNGTLKAVLPTSESLPIGVIAEGPNAGASADQRRWLAGEPGPAPGPRQVEFALVCLAAAAAGARIELIEGEGQLAIRALAI
jgi:histidine phosphotransferase ChpT